MKIDESPFQFMSSATAAEAPHGRSGGGRFAGMDGFLDDMDLSFLSLLNNLQGADKAKARPGTPWEMGMDTLEPDAKHVLAASIRLAGESAKTPPDPSAPAPVSEANPDAEVREALALLESELTPYELDVLKSLAALPGMPAIPSVSLNALMQASGEAGGPEFGKIGVSKGLAALLEKAYKTGQPIRVEMDRGSSIILKIHNGKVSAEFLTADQATALYMKQHLAELRNKMDAKNLPVGTLEYRQDDGRQHQGRRQPQNEQETR
jgi:hypothetical protein